MARPATLDHLKSRKKPTTSKVDIVLDADLADRYNQVKEEVRSLEIRVDLAANGDSDPDDEMELADARTRLAAVTAELQDQDAVVTFTFRSISASAYDILINEHPPTDEQRSLARREGQVLQFNPITFPAALVAATMLEPEASEEDVKAFWTDGNWNAMELQALFYAALECNQSRRLVDLPKG